MAAKTKFSHLSASFTKQNLNTFTAVLITSMDCDLDFYKNCQISANHGPPPGTLTRGPKVSQSHSKPLKQKPLLHTNQPQA